MIRKPTILVIEDEADIRRFLRASLEAHGFEMLEAPAAERGMHMVEDQRPDLVLLDLMLPDLDGQAVIRRLRGWSQVPIIVLSARGREEDKVTALDAGADDYLTKPFSVVELLARIRVALRHAEKDQAEAAAPVFESDGLRVDFERRQVFVSDEDVHLTPIEFGILSTLVKSGGKVVTHRQLLKAVWGPESVEENHYLRVHMTHLRRKIEADPARPRYLLTDPGVGYRFNATEN